MQELIDVVVGQFEAYQLSDVAILGKEVRANGTSMPTGSATLLGRMELPFVLVEREDDPEARSLWFKVPANRWYEQFESLKEMPWVIGWDNALGPVFEQIPLTSAYLVLSGVDGQFSDGLVANVPLKKGLNFVGSLGSDGRLAALANLVGLTDMAPIYGPITTIGDAPELAPGQHAWDLSVPPPGIQLTAPLTQKFEVGSITLGALSLRSYTPLTFEWLENHSAYVPTYGFSWELRIPKPAGSSGKDVVLTLFAQPGAGLHRLDLEGRFEGVSLENLSQLSGLSGDGTRFTSLLPEVIAKPLSKVELTYAALGIDFEEGSTQVDYLALSASLRDLNWGLLENRITLSSLHLHLLGLKPFEKDKRWTAELVGDLLIYGKKVRVTASNHTGFLIRAELQESIEINVSGLLSDLKLGEVPFGKLEIQRISLAAIPGTSYFFDVRLGKWEFSIGQLQISLEKLDLSVYHGSGSTVAAIKGRAKIGDFAELNANWTVPGGIYLEWTLEKISLKELAEKFLDSKWTDSFDVRITSANVLITSGSSGDYMFYLGADVDGWGPLALQVGEQAGKWGVTVAVLVDKGRLDPNGRLSGVLYDFVDALGLEQVCFVVSSQDMPDFRLRQSGVGSLTGLAGRTGAKEGISASATWNLSKPASNELLAALQKALNLSGTVDVDLFLGDKTSHLSVVTQGSIGPLELTSTLTIKRVGTALDFEYAAKSQLVDILGANTKFQVAAKVGTSGIFLSGSAQVLRADGTEDPKGIRFFKDVYLSRLSASIAIERSGSFNFGITAAIDTGKFQAFAAILYGSGGLVVAGAMDDLSLEDVVSAIIGSAGLIPGLDRIRITGIPVPGNRRERLQTVDRESIIQLARKILGDNLGDPTLGFVDKTQILVSERSNGSWSLMNCANLRNYDIRLVPGTASTFEIWEKAQLKYVPRKVRIGDTDLQAGFFLAAAVQVFDFKAKLRVEVSELGIKAAGDADAIVFKPLPRLFSVSAFGDLTKGPSFSIATYGPDPHIRLDGQLSFLGITSAVKANIDKEKAEIDAFFDVFGVLKGSLVVRLYPGSGFWAKGELKVEVGTLDLGFLGTYTIDGAAGIRVAISVGGRQSAFSAELEIFAKLGGVDLVTASVSIDLSYANFNNLKELVKSRVIDGVLASLGIEEVKALEQKGRWMRIEIANETSNTLQYKGAAKFDSGRFWQAPVDIQGYNRSSFSVCNKDNAWAGTSGSLAFRMVNETGPASKNQFELVLGFSDAVVSNVEETIQRLMRGDLVIRMPKLLAGIEHAKTDAQFETIRQNYYDFLQGGHIQPGRQFNSDLNAHVEYYPGPNSRIVIRERNGYVAEEIFAYHAPHALVLLMRSPAGTIYTRARLADGWNAWWPVSTEKSFISIDGFYRERPHYASLGPGGRERGGAIFAIGVDANLSMWSVNVKGGFEPYTGSLGNVPKAVSEVKVAQIDKNYLMVFLRSPEMGRELICSTLYMWDAPALQWGRISGAGKGKLTTITFAENVLLFQVRDQKGILFARFNNEGRGNLMPLAGAESFVSIHPLADETHLHLFGIDEDGSLWHCSHLGGTPGTNWSKWTAIAVTGLVDSSDFGQRVRTFSCAYSVGDHLEIFAVTEDGTVCHNYSKNHGVTWERWIANFQNAPKARDIVCVGDAGGKLDVILTAAADRKIWGNGFRKGQTWAAEWDPISMDGLES